MNNLTHHPDIYLRERVPEEIYSTIIKIRKIREKWTIKDIITSDLWPEQLELVTFERNYGDALNDFDLFGIECKKKIKKKRIKQYKTVGEDGKKDKTIMSEQTSVYSMSNIRETYQKGDGDTTVSGEDKQSKKDGLGTTIMHTSYSKMEESGIRDASDVIGGDKSKKSILKGSDDQVGATSQRRSTKLSAPGSNLKIGKGSRASQLGSDNGGRKKGDKVSFQINGKDKEIFRDQQSDTLSNVISENRLLGNWVDGKK